MAIRPVSVAAAAVLFVGSILHVVGLATPAWMTTTNGLYYGIFRICFHDRCRTLAEAGVPRSGALDACDATSVLGFLVGFTAFTLASVMVVMEFLNKEIPRFLPVLICVVSIIASIFIIVCVAVFAAHIKDSHFSYGYSFGLSIVGAIFILVGGFLACCVNSISSAYQRM